jgi:hypothetical protein
LIVGSKSKEVPGQNSGIFVGFVPHTIGTLALEFTSPRHLVDDRWFRSGVEPHPCVQPRRGHHTASRDAPADGKHAGRRVFAVAAAPAGRNCIKRSRQRWCRLNLRCPHDQETAASRSLDFFAVSGGQYRRAVCAQRVNQHVSFTVHLACARRSRRRGLADSALPDRRFRCAGPIPVAKASRPRPGPRRRPRSGHAGL